MRPLSYYLAPPPLLLKKMRADFKAGLSNIDPDYPGKVPAPLEDDELRAAFVEYLLKKWGNKIPEHYVRRNPHSGRFDSAISEDQYRGFKAGYDLGRQK